MMILRFDFLYTLMTTFLLFIFASIGLCHIIVDGAIFAPMRGWIAKQDKWGWRKLSELLGCYQCTGFWSGVAVSIMLALANIKMLYWLEFFCYGFAASFLANLGANLIWIVIAAAERLQKN